MEDWQVKLVEAAGLSAVSFLGGLGTYWLTNRAKQKDADRIQADRDAEYDAFKKKRRLVGSGDVEKMERADKMVDLIIKLKSNEITTEVFHDHRDALMTGRKRLMKTAKASILDAEAFQAANLDLKTVQDFIYKSLAPNMPEDSRRRTAVAALSIISERGPNDLPVGFDADGNKVEWIPSEEGDDDDEPYWPIPLLRNSDDIRAAAEEFYEKVCWNRYQVRMEQLAAKEGKPYSGVTDPSNTVIKRIEEKYGLENLGWNDFEWGMVNGKLSALRWVGGTEWDFLDT